MSTLHGVTRQLRQSGEFDLQLVPACVGELLDKSVADPEKAAFLEALHDKGETPTEAKAFLDVILGYAKRAPVTGTWEGKPILDCCGPGGGGLSILNVSTALVFVAAACGVPVVKHGNKGVTKKSGSSDVLEALGIRIQLNPEQIGDCLTEVGAAFIFAPAYHPAFKAVAPVRAALAREGKRTIFNLLAPLLNPVRPAAQLMGVFQSSQLDFYEEALRATGVQRALLVHGLAGHGETARPLGEASPYGANKWRGYGVAETPPEHLGEVDLDIDAGELLRQWAIEDAAHSAARIEAVLDAQEHGPTRELVLANAAAALLVAEAAPTWANAQAQARDALDSGAAKSVLEKWRSFSARLKAD